MSKNLAQVYAANPVTTVGATDLLYLAATATTDAGITGANFKAAMSPLSAKGDLYTFSTVNTRLAVAVGNGKILQVDSSAATGLSYSTPTYPSTSGTSRKVLISDGTNNVYSTETYAVPGTSGNVMTSDGTNWTSSAPLYLKYNNVAGTTQAAAINSGYVISNAAQTTVTLPATAALGSVFAVQGKGAAGWILQANTGQVINLGSSPTSSAGSLTSTNQWDSVTIVCVTANTTFAVTSVVGNLTVA